MHDLEPRHNSKRTNKCRECNEIPILKWPGSSPELNSTENDWNIIKKDIGGQLPCLNERCGGVCEA